MTKIIAKIKVFDDAEAWLQENIHDLNPDGICSIHTVDGGRVNLDGETTYIDMEDNSTKTATMKDHVNALQLLADLIGTQTLYVGGLTNPISLSDAGNWDSEVVDAFRQLVFHNEVIYG